MSKPIETVLRNKFWAKASTMEGKAHWPDKGVEYDVRNSEVGKWLMEQPEALEWVVRKAHSLGVIIYDKERNKWYGVSTERGSRLLHEREARLKSGPEDRADDR